ncbi:Xaa-Pro aminopeptidase 3 [Holothuria leucospilota]|uniref:Xaa-Pro aminopeptidase 3 n=1 Tax=Holothuria leucospilota TaxID=206669 RepID=A0A9Q1H0Y7_HOLLE|nr:Xaa-Pro aminopeptidase 3 [Holothuria leucospilota]
MWNCKLRSVKMNIVYRISNRKFYGMKPIERAFSCTAQNRKEKSVIPKRYLGQPTPFTHQHLLKKDEITPGISGAEYQGRRMNLMSAIGRSMYGSAKYHVAIILGANKKFMTDEIPYPFRQNTDFLYLCGFQEPDCALILESIPGKELPSHKATLLVQQRDSDRELWDGPRSGPEGAVQFIGVDEAYTIDSLPERLHKYLSRENMVVWYDVFRPVNESLHQEVFTNLIQPCRNRGHTVNILQQTIHAQRVIKSPGEINLMRASGSIISKAFIETMKYSRPGINEAQLYAKIDFEARTNGAEFLAYPPVVAGGNRANTLHYINNNQAIQDGDMVLMDAGCEYHGYASDVTRTWPINGKFTEAQAELYNAVLTVQKDCIEQCTAGSTLDQVYHFMLLGLGRSLQHLGILRSNLNEVDLHRVSKIFCPHHVGHYLGMDTHDTVRVSRSNQLQPGMVITIEPGVYIPATETSVPLKYRGIGIRIEDNVLITERGPEVLSRECPKEVDAIESIMAR